MRRFYHKNAIRVQILNIRVLFHYFLILGKQVVGAVTTSIPQKVTHSENFLALYSGQASGPQFAANYYSFAPLNESQKHVLRFVTLTILRYPSFK